MGNAYRDAFFANNVSDLVIELFRNVRDLKVWPFCIGRLRVSLGVFVGVLLVLYCFLDNR